MLELSAQLEALLFAAAEPLSAEQIAKACGVTASQANHGLRHLEQTLTGRGIMLQEAAGQWRLASRPEAAAAIERLRPGSHQPAELSKATLETLSVIVFQGPASQAQVEAVRGVACDQTLRTLLGKGLINEVPRPGQPPHYAASPELLAQLGVGHTGQLSKSHRQRGGAGEGHAR